MSKSPELIASDQNFDPSTNRSKWIGFGLEGEALDKVISESAKRIENAWMKEIAEAQGPRLGVEAYLRMKAVDSRFSNNVTERCAALLDSTDPRQREIGRVVLMQSALPTVLSAGGNILSKDVQSDLDPLDLIEEGLEVAWTTIRQHTFPSTPPLSEKIYKSIISIHRQNRSESDEAMVLGEKVWEVTNFEGDWVVETLVRKELEKAVGGSVSKLPPKWREVINHRFGLVDGVSEIAKTIAPVLGISDARVYQLEEDSLRRLWDDNDLRLFSPEEQEKQVPGISLYQAEALYEIQGAVNSYVNRLNPAQSYDTGDFYKDVDQTIARQISVLLGDHDMKYIREMCHDTAAVIYFIRNSGSLFPNEHKQFGFGTRERLLLEKLIPLWNTVLSKLQKTNPF